jgi:hypothetical protein
MPFVERPTIPLTLNDLVQSGWREIVVPVIENGYPFAWQPLSSAAKSAYEAGEQGKSRALWVLADAVSMMLVPKSSTSPFGASVQTSEGRSAIPSDLSAEELDVLGQFVAHVDEPWLRARLADLVWFQQRPRKGEMLLAAVDAYRSLPLTRELWLAGADDGWRRALNLVRMAGQGAGTVSQEMEAALLSAFDNAGAEPHFKLRIAQLIFDTGLAEDRQPSIAEDLVEMGTRIGAAGDGFLARDAFSLARDFFKRLHDETRDADMGAVIAESWVADAESRISGGAPGNAVAASFFENAMQAFRTVPRRERTRLNIEARLHQVQVQLGEAGARAVAEMRAVSSPSIDITDLINGSRDAVIGKKPLVALKAFASLYPGPNVDKLRAEAQASRQRFVLSRLFGATSLSRDGRVIARQDGGNLDGEDSEEQLLASMVRDHQIMAGLVIQGQMLPAIDVLRAEHNFTLQDFVNLAAACPLIPPGREHLVAKALLAGLNGDFDIALHLLTPQVEHLVRYHLKQAGILTTRVDKDGIENEIGLSSLMDLPGVDDVLSANLAFEIRAMLCNPHGPNLRNDVAHGLVDDDQANSLSSAYVWWMIFRLAFVSWWNSRRPATPSSNGNADEETQPHQEDGQPPDA